LTTIVPVSISAFWDTFVMPLCCQQLTQRLRIAASLAQMDTSITIQLYVYTVFNTFFLGVIGGAAITGVGEAIENGQIAELIGESLPTASNYFLNYAAVHALFTNLFRYFWPHDGTVLFQFLRLVKLAAQPFTERERWIIRSTPSFRWVLDEHRRRSTALDGARRHALAPRQSLTPSIPDALTRAMSLFRSPDLLDTTPAFC